MDIRIPSDADGTLVPIEVDVPGLGVLTIAGGSGAAGVGVWVTRGDDQFGICRQHDVTFAQVRCAKLADASGFPALAVYEDAEGVLGVQLPDGQGGVLTATHAELVALLKARPGLDDVALPEA